MGLYYVSIFWSLLYVNVFAFDKLDIDFNSKISYYYLTGHQLKQEPDFPNLDAIV